MQLYIQSTRIQEYLPPSTRWLVVSWVREGGCVRLHSATHWKVSRKDAGIGPFHETIHQYPGGGGGGGHLTECHLLCAGSITP